MKMIKPAIALDLQEYRCSGCQSAVRVPFDKNYNDKGTVFAGSLFSGAVLAGYRLAQGIAAKKKLKGTLVCKEAFIRYLKPILGDAVCRAKANGGFSRQMYGKRQVRVTVELCSENGVVSGRAEFLYVLIEKEGGKNT